LWQSFDFGYPDYEYVCLSKMAISMDCGNLTVEGQAPQRARAVAQQHAAIVIPTFNERANIPKLVEALIALYPEIHILVVDDHSPDGTSAAVRELQAGHANLMLLERMQNPGFAASYRDGFRRVLAEPWCRAVITMDADFSHDPAQIGSLLNKLAGHDIVLGSRYTAGGGVKNWNLRRRMLSRGANFYLHVVLGLPVRDATSGFLCMRREALEGVAVQSTVSEGYAFLVELKYLLLRAEKRFAEHPIEFDERREGQSKMSAGKIWESLWMPWRIRWRSTQDRPKRVT
jgi:dolichol-phosphate mannosyltransferase